MSKHVTYALFESGAEEFEKRAYVLGYYWNCRMNNLVLPDWRTHLDIDRTTYDKYPILFDWLRDNNNVDMVIHEETPPLCAAMLWRLRSVFVQDVSHVMCRDADAITNYKDAQCIQEWLESGYSAHCINDNNSHAGMMGGLTSFDTAYLKAVMGWNTWEDMIFDAANFDMTRLDEIRKITTIETAYACSDLARRGSDQEFMNKKIIPKIPGELLVHCFSGAGVEGAALTHKFARVNPPMVNPRLWESNLVSGFCGSPGVNNMETIRFFKRFDPEPLKYEVIERMYPEIFYWNI